MRRMATDLGDEDSALNRYRREQQQTTMPSGHVAPAADNAEEPSRKRKKRADRSAKEQTDNGQTMPTIDESIEPPPTANVDYVASEMGPAEMPNETTRNSFVHFK